MMTLVQRVGWFAIYGTTIQAMLLLLFMAFVQYSNVPGRTLTNHTGTTDATSDADFDVYPSKRGLQLGTLLEKFKFRREIGFIK